MATSSESSKKEETVGLLFDLATKQREHCQLLLNGEAKSSPHKECLQKAVMSIDICTGLLEMKESVNKAKAYQQALQKYVQSILDSTYYQECVLVDYDFPQVTVKEDINALLNQFATFMKLCGSTESQLISILGEDIMECIHWRVGALMYMLANTIMNMETRRETVDKNWLRECCYVGVLHLMMVFEVRTPLTASTDEYTTNDQRIVELLSQGIRSDTHMLALAYGGELSYWCITNNGSNEIPQYPQLYKVLDTVTEGADRPSIQSVGSIGMKFLSRYIELAKGSLSMQSWQCERPEELLAELRKQ
ncbi:PREDICTED: UPF0600 protein C5orf51 homolog isoform X1 [Amphimedon queenslandica]|uniref:Uncharacterized protein n=2 Tax=Amphimedon queenslandica TaxID=400682 RepID=A0AAN0JAU4_AMPQE|nr:PREDICTED: UPF0600 protein C5orf51 homolog isoform X1 [Amphimedon queenslandica]|eukprot:XP_019853887.1 PREDICTED: UPF0600 protein C5orf51 homolog isoform X1 [Amphimedon queenslandica]